MRLENHGVDIVRTRLAALSIMLAATACLFGIDITTPIAIADSLPNGYAVTCTPNGNSVICNISGGFGDRYRSG
jgi:hypothetical protein